MKNLEIVVFSGGRGTRAIQEAFSGVGNVRVTYLINGYDSGLSTGEVRRIIPGMLGPSDFRKALTGISQSYDTASARELSTIFDYRLPLEPAEAADAFLRWGDVDSAMEFIAEHVPGLPIKKAIAVASEIVRFTQYVQSSEGIFDCTDLAVGNAYFGGAFLRTGSFNDALDDAKELFEFPESVDILNVTQGDDLWLAVFTDRGDLSVEEGHFVNVHPPAPISEVMLVDRATFYKYRDEYSEWAPAEKSVLDGLRENALAPKSDARAIERLRNASLIVYGSGTLHSSLIPSYITENVREAIADNNRALKIVFVNGTRDMDIHESVAREGTLDLYEQYFGDGRSDLGKYVTEAWITGDGWDDNADDALSGSASYRGIPLRQLTDSERKKYTDQESYSALSQSLSRHVGTALSSKSNIATVVIPMWNELDRLPQLQQTLEPLTKTSAGSLVEIIVADGDSSDGSAELVATWPDIRLVGGLGRGRGTAVRRGIEESRGSTVAVFHADNEYQVDDLAHLLSLAESQPDKLFLASRTHGAGGEYALRRIYAGHRVQYWLSRAGGVLISAVLSLRLGRTISDPFSGVFASSRKVAERHFRFDGDVDALIRGVVSAHKAGVPIVEVGVVYQPRTKAEGKKTNTRSGLAALWAAIAR